MGKTSSPAEVISIPKGGGALQGIGEKFAPDLFTGTGNFTVPIALPPGRNGFQPELNLVYSTGNGNGPFGLGWALSIPGVSRNTSQGVPRYDDEKDVFVLSGAEDLVPVERSGDVTRYQPRTEGLFAKIERHHSPESCWIVSSKDGLVSEYGTEPFPAPTAGGSVDPTVIACPQQPARIFAWKLTRTSDPFGNRIEYEYERDRPKQGPRVWDQLYLKRIRYVDYLHGDTIQFLVTVTFCYEDRPDPFSDYRSGFEIRTRKRCTRIEIRTHPDQDRGAAENGLLVRTYEFCYLDQREDRKDQGAQNGASLLSRILVVGHDEQQPDESARTEELPPLEFHYTQFEPLGRDFLQLSGQLPARSLADPNIELVDLFGNGLPDFLELNGTVRYWRNLGQGRFDWPREMADAPAGLQLGDKGVQLLDADGDGRIDLLVTRESLSGYFPARFDGGWDHRSFQRYETAPSFDLKDPQVRLLDLDGDGVTDALRSGSRLECYFNDPKAGWKETRWVERGRLDVFPNLDFADSRVRFSDMTGDGLQDAVLIMDGNVEYWASLGFGDWAPRISMRNGPRFPYGYDPRRILLGDVDGDGLADIVYVDDAKVTLWINQSGNAWSDPLVIHGTPPVSDMDSVRLIDLLGTGISGILWTRDAGPDTSEQAHFLDFTGGIKPYLLDTMDNHMGAVTRVKYAPSTRFYLEDERQRPTRWKTPLPFPVQTVAQVEVIDAISGGKLTTEYRYHHGYWDGAEREFRGFGRVDQRDTEVFGDYHAPGLHPAGSFNPVERKSFSPPLETRTWFHHGPIGDEFGTWDETDFSGEFWSGDFPLLQRPSEVTGLLKALPRRARRDALRVLRGRILRTELYALDGTERQAHAYSITEHLYGVREESPPGPGPPERLRIFFAHTLAQRTTQWERGEDPLTQVAFTDDYDRFGQPRRQTSVALPRRSLMRRPITGAVVGMLTDDEMDKVNETHVLATHTRTEYAEPTLDRNIHDRVAQVRNYELEDPPRVVETAPGDLAQVLRDQVAAAQQIHLDRFGDLDSPTVRLIGHTINHYDGPAFQGLGPGEVGAFGALTRSETLVFTDRELDEGFRDRRPSYLGGNAELPPGAPAGFGASLGYRDQGEQDYYADTRRLCIDVQDAQCVEKRGLVVAQEDALGNRTTIDHDPAWWLLPVRVVDPAGLETTAAYDERLLQPLAVTDPNGNCTCFRYGPLGLLQKQFLQGREGEGGTEQQPEAEFQYDFLAYDRTRDQEHPLPIHVHARRRVHHASQGLSDDVIESREYSDGFGRLIQTRAQAEELVFGADGDDVGLPAEPGSQPGPAVGRRAADRVVVSGWQVFDNKGRAVQKYEPFFDQGWDYQPEEEAKQGQHATVFYDPRGQVIRTVNPDGSEQRVLFGVPLVLRDPTRFYPTPWESYSYDANDLAPLTHPLQPDGSAGNVPADHHFTPSSSVIDALGRSLCQVDRNGPDSGDDWHVTRFRYDIRGNLIQIFDPLGRKAFEHSYDLRNNRLRVKSIDAGLRTTVLDANGNPVEYRDSKGSIALRQYDHLNRLIHLWARWTR